MVDSGAGEDGHDGPGEEAPLDPAVERVRARLRRLMLISALTTILGFAAVAVAIVYRLSPAEDRPAEATADRPVALEPAVLPERLSFPLAPGAEVLSASATAREVVLLVAVGDGRAVIIVDRASGRIVQRLDIVPPAPGG